MFKQLSINALMGLLLIGLGFNSWSVVTSNELYKNVSTLEHKNGSKPSLQNFGKSKKDDLKANTGKFLVELTDARQKEIASHLFSKNGKLKAGEKSLEVYSLQELSVLSRPDQDKGLSLYNAIDKTETAAGSVVLSALLSNPVNDISVIKKRQKLINFLLENEQVFDYLNDLIKQVKSGQNSLLNYWNEEAALDENVKSLLYCSKDSRLAFLNRSPVYHQLYKVASFVNLAVTGLFLPPVVAALVAAGPISLFVLAIGDIQSAIKLGFNSVILAAWLMTSKAFFNYVRLVHRTVFSMHQRLRHIGKLAQSFDDLFYTLQNHTELSEALSLVNNMSDFVVDPQSISNDLSKLKDFLNRSIFDKEKFGLFSHAGSVIVAQEYMDQAKDSFIVPFEAVGELDAYLSVVKLIKEYRTKSGRFCFVDFVEQPNPMMNLQGAWSLLVGASRSKPVDIALGGEDNPNNAIIAGPIGSGKSILTQTIGSCNILGRAFGIAPAKKAVMTMFDKVCTHINVKENGKMGSSSYANERARGIEIMNYIRKNPTKKILAIIDEPYNNLIDESAEMLTYDLVSEIAKYPNVTCVVAAKHKKLTDLAEETGKFANYHFDVSETTPNDFDRTFNLVPGKCDWWFTDAGKRNRYIKLLD